VILDSSAVIAIVMREPEHEDLLAAIAADGRPAIGAANARGNGYRVVRAAQE